MIFLKRGFLRSVRSEYPTQFWLLFWGLMISTIGASMIWPFLMIYVSKKLSLPVTAAASLMTINATFGLIFAFVAGPLTDRLGRKWVMVVSLAMNGVIYLLMSQASTLLHFQLLMALTGVFNPLYRIGADAMMADLIPPDRRADAYSLLRTSNNVGVALGPAVGGFIASASYTIAFIIAASGMIFYSLLVSFRARETLPQHSHAASAGSLELLRGYKTIGRDRRFVAFVFAYTLNQVCAALIWILLGMYANKNYQIQESQYGFIPMTNALMVVFFQVFVTRWTKRYPALWMLALGTFFYAIGTGSVAWGHSFWAFWLSMVILTIGELISTPTATTLVANLAPADMRGRYMSIYGLTWNVAAGIGPLYGGILSDNFGPVYAWYGGLGVGLVSVAAFITMAQRLGTIRPAEASVLNLSKK
jgi:MFS family permease